MFLHHRGFGIFSQLHTLQCLIFQTTTLFSAYFLQGAYFDSETRACYDDTCMETLATLFSIHMILLLVCVSYFIATFCIFIARFSYLLSTLSNWFSVFKTLMVSLFFRFKLLMVSLLFYSYRNLRFINQTWLRKRGWYGWFGSGAATGSCVIVNGAPASLTYHWRYETPFLFFIPTRFPFSGIILV